MKITRRDMLKSVGGASALALPLANGYSAQPSKTRDKTESATLAAIRPIRLDAEPLVKSSYPTHERFNDEIAEQLVVITAKGIEHLDWGQQHKKICWLLRLPEMLYVNHVRFDLQVGMDWRKEQGTWLYTDCPVRNLTGRWKIIDEKYQLAPGTEQEVPTVGKMDASIQSDSLGMHYTLSVTNTSDETWKDVFFWFCLNHYQSRITGYRPHLRLGRSWLPAQEMPSAQHHRYYPAPGMVAEHERIKADRGSFRGDSPELSFPGVVCWNYTSTGPVLMCHCSKDAVGVGSNQLWPCTDLFLWFGEIAPGEQTSKTGHILLARCDLKTFADHADSILDTLK